MVLCTAARLKRFCKLHSFMRRMCYVRVDYVISQLLVIYKYHTVSIFQTELTSLFSKLNRFNR